MPRFTFQTDRQCFYFVGKSLCRQIIPVRLSAILTFFVLGCPTMAEMANLSTPGRKGHCLSAYATDKNFAPGRNCTGIKPSCFRGRHTPIAVFICPSQNVSQRHILHTLEKLNINLNHLAMNDYEQPKSHHDKDSILSDKKIQNFMKFSTVQEALQRLYFLI